MSKIQERLENIRANAEIEFNSILREISNELFEMYPNIKSISFKGEDEYNDQEMEYRVRFDPDSLIVHDLNGKVLEYDYLKARNDGLNMFQEISNAFYEIPEYFFEFIYDNPFILVITREEISAG